MKLEDPGQVSAILQRVRDAYAGKQFTVDQFRDFLKTGNASDSPFYNKSATGQATSAAAGNPPAIEAAITQAQREALYKALDPENEGAGPREIQQRTGKVMDLRSAAERRNNSINMEKPVTVGDAVSKFGKSLVNTITGGVLGKADTVLSPPTSLLHPVLGPTDALIGKLFEHAPEASPIPEPSSLLYPSNPKQIAAPSYKMPPVADTSGAIYNERNNPILPKQKLLGAQEFQPPRNSGGVVEGGPYDESLGQQRGQEPSSPVFAKLKDPNTMAQVRYGRPYSELTGMPKRDIDSLVSGNGKITMQEFIKLGKILNK